MKGDFSRSTFNAQKHYRGVRLQQGRVQLDADWNEQVDIQSQQSQCELRDLLGTYGAPQASAGFAITLPTALATPDPSGQLTPPDVQIAKGQRYVDGILCISERDHSFSRQPDFPGASQHRQEQSGYPLQLVYLDVWQHHVTAREDPDLREVALDGLDTTTRIQTVTQVKFWPWRVDNDKSGNAQDDNKQDGTGPKSNPPILSSAFTAFSTAQPKQIGMLEGRKTDESAIPQNQLYRVEIHSVANDSIGFKWSRENGAVAYSILEIKANDKNSAYVDIYLKDVKSNQLDLQNKGWVEITSNHHALNGKAGVFGSVMDIQPDISKITVQPVLTDQISVQDVLSDGETCKTTSMVLQRWDQRGEKEHPLDDGTVIVRFDGWTALENGLEVKFTAGAFAVGDYWLIPARTNLKQGTGDILWPQGTSQPPAGIAHHYAPLALLHYTAGAWQIADPDKSTFRTLPVLSDDVDELVKRMTKAEGEIDQLQDDVAQLKTDEQDLDRRVTALERRMEKVEERLDALQHIHLYQDFHSDRELKEGMVVAYSSSKPGHVEKVNMTNAALLLGVVVDDHRKPTYRVAMQGRTKCKVVGALKPGVLLIPSSKEGYAEPAGLYLQPGTVLGKVLGISDDYRNGKTDEVDVLITLN